MTKIKKTTPSKTNNIITMAEKGMWIKQTGSTKRHCNTTFLHQAHPVRRSNKSSRGVLWEGLVHWRHLTRGQKLNDKLHGSRHSPRDWAVTCMDMPCWNASRRSGSSGQNDPASHTTLHPTWLVRKQGTLPLGSPRHEVKVSWKKAPGRPSNRHTLHFTRGGKVNTSVAFSENLLSKSTRNPADISRCRLRSVLSAFKTHSPILVGDEAGHPGMYASTRCWHQCGDNNTEISVSPWL